MTSPPSNETKFFEDLKKENSAEHRQFPEDPKSSTSEQEQPDHITRRNKSKERTENKEHENSPEHNENELTSDRYFLKSHLQIIHNDQVVDENTETFPVDDPLIQAQDLNTDFRTRLLDLNRSVRNSIEDWPVEPDMAMPIRDITKLIPEFDGNEKTLDTFIKKINRLWDHIVDYEDNDKNQFMLVLQLKLVGKAAEAVQDNEFETWDDVRTNLRENILPHRNTEKSEFKLGAVKQREREDVEAFAKRVQDAEGSKSARE